MQNYGFQQLYETLKLRWEWLKSEKRLCRLRNQQDIKWIKSIILKEFGDKGLQKIKNDLWYKNSPFKELIKLKRKFSF